MILEEYLDSQKKKYEGFIRENLFKIAQSSDEGKKADLKGLNRYYTGHIEALNEVLEFIKENG
jgi:hypothetical protein